MLSLVLIEMMEWTPSHQITAITGILRQDRAFMLSLEFGLLWPSCNKYWSPRVL